MRSGVERVEILLLVYASLIFSTVLILSYLTVSRIDIYLAAFAIEYFVAVLATAPYGPKEAKRQMLMGAVFMILFAVVVVERLLEILK